MTPNVVEHTKIQIEDKVNDRMDLLPRRDRRRLKATVDRLRRRSPFKIISDFKCPEMKAALRSGTPVLHILPNCAVLFQLRKAVIYLVDIFLIICREFHAHVELLLLESVQDFDVQNRRHQQATYNYQKNNILPFHR
jgi:hypothetical protein